MRTKQLKAQYKIKCIIKIRVNFVILVPQKHEMNISAVSEHNVILLAQKREYLENVQT